MHLLRQQDIPSDFARCVADEDNRGGIIFAQQLGKVIKGSQILKAAHKHPFTLTQHFNSLTTGGFLWI